MIKARTGASLPVIIGEILYERFADRTKVPGESPFNVAWHLQLRRMTRLDRRLPTSIRLLKGNFTKSESS